VESNHSFTAFNHLIASIM